MLEQILDALHNDFAAGEPIRGTFAVRGGTLPLDCLAENQYYRIAGSVFNDGVHRHPAADLTDETFDGAVVPMAVPPAVLELADEIGAWVAQYGGAAANPYLEESVNGVYSYRLREQRQSWRDAFAARLSRWRKLS
ncbi:MAG: hypothetical protein IKE30_07300 [Clostridia bacterium]|nr:hypothetical protein [Clostridia bacterium]